MVVSIACTPLCEDNRISPLKGMPQCQAWLQAELLLVVSLLFLGHKHQALTGQLALQRPRNLLQQTHQPQAAALLEAPSQLCESVRVLLFLRLIVDL